MASRAYTTPSRTGTSSSRGQDSYKKPAPRGPSTGFMAAHLGIKRAKASTPVSSQPKKRKLAETSHDDEKDEFAVAMGQKSLAGLDEPKSKKPRKKDEEKRLKQFRAKPPRTYLERLDRVRTQRMFLVDRNRTTSSCGTHEEEVFDIAGTTGNIYQVTISKVPSCTCPDNGKGNQCKHIIYHGDCRPADQPMTKDLGLKVKITVLVWAILGVMVNILKARPDLAYQLAFLTTELAEIFANAPVTLQAGSAEAATATDKGGQRKPIEGDCPVCVMEFDESDKSEDILWCKAACGNNIHRHCFEQWARTKSGEVKCVYCRTPWKGDEDSIKRISKSGSVNADGYVNVASELGLSGDRDMSSYHPYWVQREYGGYYGGRRGY
ncbi:hypothetical protein G7Y89_g11365 [Cudoniella acicularis]|uniref:Uncharacterized protein n=1 Tax=Cudoniella acicularis TaxID=354080 RepID=A0A8H4VXX1_9HELO|nr:hypothetical protein G7Y89_g11365 [Cudoniella acicularis]